MLSASPTVKEEKEMRVVLNPMSVNAGFTHSSISFTCEDCKAREKKLNKRVRALNQRTEEIEMEVASNHKDIVAVGNKVEDLKSISKT